MDREFVVNGRYLAKYPDGRYSGEVGLCTHVKAPDKSAAVKQAMQKTIFFHGYVNMEWIAVEVKDVTPEDEFMAARPSA